MHDNAKAPPTRKRIFLPTPVRYAIISSWGFAVALMATYLLFKLGY